MSEYIKTNDTPVYNYQKDIIKEKDKEIGRLNNIINELEKEFNKTIKDPLIHLCYKRISREYFDKLQELKGEDKE